MWRSFYFGRHFFISLGASRCPVLVALAHLDILQQRLSHSAAAAATTMAAAPPNDLKSLAPFLQRAHETRTADPALSYWCNYHAAQLGIPLLSSLQPSSKAFLMELMDTLEEQKKSLADNDIVTGDDLVAKAYVEGVALKVFAGADNEDRGGKANKATARRFLVASNFIEVLSNFGPLERDVSTVCACN